MSDIKLKAASGGGSISLKGPSSLGSDRDLVDTSGNINLLDSQKLKVGDSDDLQIYSSSDHSHVYNSNTTGKLRLRSDSDVWIEHGTENMIVAKGDDAVELYHNGTKQCETSANGLAFPSGKGIDFSATSDANGKDNELLDDYEEGTWTPALTNGPSLSSAHGRYTKIGRMVYATFQLNCGSDGTAAHVYINNLPFASISGNPNAGSVAWDYRNGMTIITHISQGTARIYFYNNNGGALEGNESQFESKEHRGTAIYTAA